MKNELKLYLAAFIALALPAAGHADTLTQAQITQIIKDVKTIDPAKGSHAAVMKETLQGDQSVRTGIDSRTELLFNDHTITRLGANTHFSFSEGTRNMSLQSGVMLLQVPKGSGGAKIETAAITAAVTGTTIMIESGPTYTKLIVLEGECCVWPKNDKKGDKFFKFKHKSCLVAGQELILRNGAKTIPDPVYVNLKILEKTSLLITGNWGSNINPGPINAAADGQGPDDYIPTNLAIIGAGTDVTVIEGQLPDNPPGNPPPGGGTPPFIPPGKYGPLTTINPGNPYSIGGGSAINTDPTITTGGVTSYGRIYRGTFDGNAANYLLGTSSSDLDNAFSDENNNAFPNYGVAAFKFSSLTLQQMPAIVMSGNGANDLALIAEGDLGFEPTTPTTFDFSQIYDVTFATIGGSLHVNDQTTITGAQHSVNFYNSGAGQITIDGLVDMPLGNVFASTKGTFGGGGQINADVLGITAGGVVTLHEDFDSEGEFYTDTVNGVVVTTDTLQSLSLTGNEVDANTGFHGSPFNSEQANADLTLTAHSDGLTLPGNINLSGHFEVGYFSAYADQDITTANTTTIHSSGNIYFSAGGDINVAADVSAYTLTLLGNNVTTSTPVESEFNIFFDMHVTATNTATIGGDIVADSFTVDDSTNTVIPETGSINAGYITITASGSVQINGTVQGNDDPATNFTSNSGGGITPFLVAPTNPQDFSGTGSIDAQTIDINSGADLVLNNHAVNGVSINPNGNLRELDLSGATIEITSDYNDVEGNDNIVTMKLNANGDITISNAISVSEFDATTGGKFVLTGSPSVAATTISLTLPTYDASITQPTPAGSAYIFTESSSGTAIGTLPLDVGNKAGVLSVSANSINLGNITAGESGLYLSFTAVTDINSGTGSSINGANSVALQVGVDATLTGDGNTEINYNNGQVITGISNLDTYSMTANSITVTGGFPDISNAALILNSSGTGGITTVSSLNVFSLSGTAALGDININGDLSVARDLNLTASNGNIVFAIADPTIGGSLNLSAGGAIELDNDISINGFLFLSAGTFIHTSTESLSVITGATDITLNLGAPADLSTGGTEIPYLFFDASIGQEGFVPVGIALDNSSSVSATATQLTLTNDFDRPGTQLDLTANAGSLTLNGAITTDSFYGSASSVITGTGSVTAGYISLSQSGSATISQSGSSPFLFNGLTINPSSEGTSTLVLSAEPLTLSTALTLPNTDLDLYGGINSQNNLITAQNVSLNGVHTTTDASGNGTNLSINAYSLSIYGMSLTGLATGHGGTFTVITESGSFPGDINVSGTLAATGGSASGAGGNISLTTQGNMNVNTYIGEGQYVGGNINANGGDALITSASPGGNGGTVNLTADGDLAVYGNITATTGVNGNGTFTGGNGGTVSLTSNNGTVSVGSTVEVSSSDLVNHRVSAKGGNINVTSHKLTGVAINISDSGQLNSLLNQASPGPGGAITFLADKGGSISVSGKVRADHGAITVQTGTSDGTGAGGAVTLSGANLSADIVKVGSLGSNGSLIIGSSVINGDTAIKLYAAGNNGTVQFVGPTSLTGASVKSIAGNTVTINQNVTVNVTGGQATVYTNNANYNLPGGTNPSVGSFTGNSNTTTQPFANRPAF